MKKREIKLTWPQDLIKLRKSQRICEKLYPDYEIFFTKWNSTPRYGVLFRNKKHTSVQIFTDDDIDVLRSKLENYLKNK